MNNIVTKIIKANIEDASPASWPSPQPLLSKTDPEEYPIDALPDTIRKAIEEVQSFVKAPISLVASSALATLSVAIQAHVDVKRAEKLQGPSGLFFLTIADSGERKSTSDGYFSSAIRIYQEQQAMLMKPTLEKYQALIDGWDAEREGILAAIKSAKKAGKDTTELQKTLWDHQSIEPKPPKVPRLLLGDETPESLAWGLSKQWPSGGIVSNEAGLIFGSHAMGKDTAMRNMALLNILWDGGTHSVGRKTSESFTVRGARLTMALQVQEGTLRNFLDKSGSLASDTGFLARFLVARPESTQGYRPFTEPPNNWPHTSSFNKRIAEILSNPVIMDEEGGLIPNLITFTSSAKAAWVEFHDEIESELTSSGELYNVRDVASKAADNAARMAALFQVFEKGLNNKDIEFSSFEAASRVVAWHLNESRRFHGELALPKELSDAVRLDKWLIAYCQQKNESSLKKNHIRQYGPIRDGERLSMAISELEELDRIKLVENGKSNIVLINPILLEASDVPV